jgi:phosphohistidine phosphatase SixA
MKTLAGVGFAMLACASAWASDGLWSKVAGDPGIVVLMRNTQASGGSPSAWDASGGCKGELMLTEAGKARAKRIGEAFAARGIKPQVISSPMCRSLDTARIAFGISFDTDEALRDLVNAEPARRQAFERKAVQMIRERRGRVPIVFVSHQPNVDVLSMELIDLGDLLVTRADEEGRLEVLGKLRID